MITGRNAGTDWREGGRHTIPQTDANSQGSFIQLSFFKTHTEPFNEIPKEKDSQKKPTNCLQYGAQHSTPNQRMRTETED